MGTAIKPIKENPVNILHTINIKPTTIPNVPNAANNRETILIGRLVFIWYEKKFFIL